MPSLPENTLTSTTTTAKRENKKGNDARLIERDSKEELQITEGQLVFGELPLIG